MPQRSRRSSVGTRLEFAHQLMRLGPELAAPILWVTVIDKAQFPIGKCLGKYGTDALLEVFDLGVVCRNNDRNPRRRHHPPRRDRNAVRTRPTT